MTRFVLALALLCGGILALIAHADTAPQAEARPYSTVTDARLLHPEARNWLLFRGNYNANGYSALCKITSANAKELVPVWTFATGLREGHQSPPLVNDGVIGRTTSRIPSI